MTIMIDRFTVPLLTPSEAAQNLQIPEPTIRNWLADKAAGRPLVHGIRAHRGFPSMPFIALVEAYVLRSLRNIGLTPRKITQVASDIRKQFKTEYGLASRRTATDGIDVFIHYLDVDIVARAGDGQLPIREVINDYLQYILWEDDDEFPTRLTLRRYDPNTAKVVIDPRFAWGAPVVESTKTPVSAVLGMWWAGEPPEIVADEYGLTVDQVEALVRVAA